MPHCLQMNLTDFKFPPTGCLINYDNYLELCESISILGHSDDHGID